VVSRLPRVLQELPDVGGDARRRALAAADLERLRGLEDRIGHRFTRPALLRVALTHVTWVGEHPGSGWPSHACLEFLGDAVLGVLAADALWRRFPELDEGSLTRLRAVVVEEESLAAEAARIGLGEWLWLGRGQEQQGGRAQASTLADAVEAVIGAVFLDAREAGAVPLAAAEATFQSLFAGRLETMQPSDGEHPKARLQHLTQARWRVAPVYERIGAPPDPGAPHWCVCAQLHHDDGRVQILGTGEGRSLRQAERAAAEDALARLAADEHAAP
jgi:ribonuclease-3